MNGLCVHNNQLFFLILFLLCTLFIKPLISSEQEETLIEEFIICRHCGSDITISNFFLNKLSPLASAAANQTFYKNINVLVQTLDNSLGITFRVIVVHRAHCANISTRWNNHFTWFPGYSWKVCLCPKCAKHLGWMFEPVESAINEPNFPSENGFYALIYKEILGESYVNSLLITEKYHKEL